MRFQIPADLDVFSRAGLTDLRRVAFDEFTSLQATITASNTDGANIAISDLDDAEKLAAFIASADAKLATYAEADARVAKITATDLAVKAAAVVDEPLVGEVLDPVTAAAPAAPETGGATTQPRLTVADIAPETIEGIKPSTSKAYSIIAAADTGAPVGSELPDMAALTAAFQNRVRSYGGATKAHRRDDALQHGVATIERKFAENLFYTEGMGEVATYNMGEYARSEKRLEGGSLLNAVTAGVAWCSPSETIYSTCSQITASGLIDLPEIGARRGGIRHNQGIEFSSVFGGGTGYNILTEAQVIADTVKTCVQVPCPTFVDDRLKVAALCITGDILQNVSYPEFVQTFIEAAIAVQAHNINKDVIATLVAGSTAVNLAQLIDPWQGDMSVVSQVMAAAEQAVWDIRYRLRLDPSATIEMVFPYWLLAQMRADWLRRNAAFPADLTDQMIAQMFNIRGVRPQYVYDWQDAFSGLTTTGPGAATPLLVLPQSPTVNLQFLAYPAGTWVLARQNVIRLDSVYDSTLLSTNKVTQLFLEDGYLPMRMCPLSRVYTVNICPNGSTGVQRAVACTDVTP